MSGEPIHVTPVNDLREHDDSRECWCRPRVEEDGAVIVHNSMDRREHTREKGKLQ